MDAVLLLPLLSQSLSSDPATRRQSERQLAQHESAPGFLISVLAIVQGAGEAPMEIRLAAGIYFKNAVRKMWAEVRPRPLASELSAVGESSADRRDAAQPDVARTSLADLGLSWTTCCSPTTGGDPARTVAAGPAADQGAARPGHDLALDAAALEAAGTGAPHDLLR
jgi:hypothetical protein